MPSRRCALALIGHLHPSPDGLTRRPVPNPPHRLAHALAIRSREARRSTPVCQPWSHARASTGATPS